MAQFTEAPTAVNEGALIARVARGEEGAVAVLVRDYGNAVFRYLYRRNRESYDEAQDLTQETFLAAVSMAHSFDGTCSATTWLCSIAKIKLADHLRRTGRQKRVPNSKLIGIDSASAEAIASLHGGKATLDEVVEKLDAQAFLDAITSQLSEDERDALILHYVDGFSIDEMTHLMKRSSKGVESLLTRAKKRCRETAAGWLT
jgi:RNA polymerase sigma-70 factor (ECF subfamily)